MIHVSMHLTIMEQTRTKTYDTRDKLDIRMFRMLHTQFRGTVSVLRSRPGQHVTRASAENVACEHYICIDIPSTEQPTTHVLHMQVDEAAVGIYLRKALLFNGTTSVRPLPHLVIYIRRLYRLNAERVG